MTDDVAALVLADNIAQNALLGISRVTAPQMLGVHRRQLTDLTKARGLDRKLERCRPTRRSSVDSRPVWV